MGGFLRGQLDGLALQATDHPWTRDRGALVTGYREALALSFTSRRPPRPLGHLDGDGATTRSGPPSPDKRH